MFARRKHQQAVMGQWHADCPTYMKLSPKRMKQYALWTLDRPVQTYFMSNGFFKAEKDLEVLMKAESKATASGSTMFYDCHGIF